MGSPDSGHGGGHGTEGVAGPAPTVLEPRLGLGIPAGLHDSPDEAGSVRDDTGTTGALRRYYGFQLLSEVNLTGGIWILFLQDRGFSLGQIGLAEALFHLAPITLELPTGSLADTVGRKWSLAIGSLCAVLSALLLLATTNLWVVCAAMYLSGASMTFRSGAQTAFLYDALAERGTTDRFTSVFGRLMSASYLVAAAAYWLGATLADISFTWPYALTAMIGLAGATVAAGLREPEREREAHAGIRQTIGAAMTIVRRRPGLAALLAFAAILWTLVTLIELYAQAVLKEYGLATSTIGLLIGGSFALVAAGAWVAHRVTARGGFPAWSAILTAAVIAAGLGLGSGSLVLAVITYVIAEFATGLYEPILADRVNRDLPAAQRATILSVQGLLFSLTMVWAFPLAGWIAERAGWLTMYALAGLGTGIALLIWLAVGGRDEAPLVANEAAP